MNTKQKAIPIFFHASNEYAAIMTVLIASILYNTKSFIEFYIIETGISDFNKRETEKMKTQFSNFSIEWIKFEYGEIFKREYFDGVKKNAEAKSWPGVHAFCTPFLPLLKPHIDKLIYLDLDVIVLGDIKQFFEQDLEDFALAAVPDIILPLYVNQYILSINPYIDYGTYGKYFNAGVLLINAKKFRDDNVIQEYFMKAHNEVMQICDQDVLNRLFGDGKFKPLDLKYNFIYLPRQEQLDDKQIGVKASDFENALEHIVIRHFANAKPWNSVLETWSHTTLLHQKEFWFFAKMSPFYEGISKELNTAYALSLLETNKTTPDKVVSKINQDKATEISSRSYYLFRYFPFLKIRIKNQRTKITLFGFIPLLKID